MTETPFWKGRLFKPSENAETNRYQPGFLRREDAFGCLVAVRLEALPFAVDVEAAITMQPAAADDIRDWAHSWNTSFPGWEASSWAGDARRFRNDINRKLERARFVDETISEFLASESKDNDAIKAYNIEGSEKYPATLAGDDEPRARIARVLRTARAFRAGCLMPPFCIGFEVFHDGQRALSVTLTGRDTAGTPILSALRYAFAGYDPRGDDNLWIRFFNQANSRETPAYWDWKFLRAQLARTVVGVQYRAGGDNGRVRLAGALADMAAQGERTALVSFRHDGKRESKILAIRGIKTIREAVDQLSVTMPAASSATVENEPHYITRSRFFIHGGRVIGSKGNDPLLTPSDPDADRERYGRTALDMGDVRAIDLFAEEVSTALRENGVQECAVEIGLNWVGYGLGPRFEVVSVDDLWTSDFLAFDPATLIGEVAEGYLRFETMLDKVLAEAEEWPRFSRFAKPFREIVQLYGKSAMVAFVLSQNNKTTSWTEEDFRTVLRRLMVGFVLMVSIANAAATTDEESASVAKSADMHFLEGFRQWLTASEAARAIVMAIPPVNPD
jgi:hypothetical protein